MRMKLFSRIEGLFNYCVYLFVKFWIRSSSGGDGMLVSPHKFADAVFLQQRGKTHRRWIVSENENKGRSASFPPLSVSLSLVFSARLTMACRFWPSTKTSPLLFPSLFFSACFIDLTDKREKSEHLSEAQMSSTSTCWTTMARGLFIYLQQKKGTVHHSIQ